MGRGGAGVACIATGVLLAVVPGGSADVGVVPAAVAVPQAGGCGTERRRAPSPSPSRCPAGVSAPPSSPPAPTPTAPSSSPTRPPRRLVVPRRAGRSHVGHDGAGRARRLGRGRARGRSRCSAQVGVGERVVLRGADGRTLAYPVVARRQPGKADAPRRPVRPRRAAAAGADHLRRPVRPGDPALHRQRDRLRRAGRTRPPSSRVVPAPPRCSALRRAPGPRGPRAPGRPPRGNLAGVSTSTAAAATTPAPEHAAVRAAAQRAAAAAPGVRAAGGPAIDAALRTAAALRDRADDLLAANAADVEAATRRHGRRPARPAAPHPRAARRHGHPARGARRHPGAAPQRFVRTLPTGERVFERRVPVGVIGAVFEARPNVTVDVASQVLKARSAAVLRTGAAALGSATALVEQVIAPVAARERRPRRRRPARPDARPRRRRRAGRAARPRPARRGARQRRGHPPALGARRGRRHPRARPRRRRRGALPRRERGRGGGRPADPRQHGPARRLQPAQPAARRPPRVRPALARRRDGAAASGASPRACRRTRTGSATSGRWTPATRRT